MKRRSGACSSTFDSHTTSGGCRQRPWVVSLVLVAPRCALGSCSSSMWFPAMATRVHQVIRCGPRLSPTDARCELRCDAASIYAVAVASRWPHISEVLSDLDLAYEVPQARNRCCSSRPGSGWSRNASRAPWRATICGPSRAATPVCGVRRLRVDSRETMSSRRPSLRDVLTAGPPRYIKCGVLMRHVTLLPPSGSGGDAQRLADRPAKHPLLFQVNDQAAILRSGSRRLRR